MYKFIYSFGYDSYLIVIYLDINETTDIHLNIYMIKLRGFNFFHQYLFPLIK